MGTNPTLSFGRRIVGMVCKDISGAYDGRMKALSPRSDGWFKTNRSRASHQYVRVYVQATFGLLFFYLPHISQNTPHEPAHVLNAA
jgi:hypothetical protein